MSEDYRERIQMSRMLGEAIRLPYKEHCKETLIKQLWERLEPEETGPWETYLREETENEDMLWLLNREEEVARGIYSWNRPMVDLVIVAPPALMALIMGEYELAAKLSEREKIPAWKNRVEELYQDGRRAGIGGGGYTFGEACLLSSDMPVSVKLFFWQKGYYDLEKLAMEDNELLLEAQYHRTGAKGEADIWRPIEEVRELSGLLEDTRELLGPAVQYALRLDMDRNCEQFWDRMYQMFPAREERVIIVEALHAYFVNLCSAESLSPHYEERVLAGVQAYFEHDDKLSMTGAIKDYLLERIATKSYMHGSWRPYLERYMDMVKAFDGGVSKEWQQGMYELLKSKDEQWLRLGFRSGFLKRDCIQEYIEYFLQEHFRTGRGYSEFVSRLIQMKWQGE